MLAIYTRLSQEDDFSNSIKNQLREGRKFAEIKGFSDYKTYDEGMGLSGGLNISERPELSKLIKDIVGGSIKAVWFRNQNRLERSSLTFHTFVDIVKKAKIDVYFGDILINYNDANTFLQSSIISSLNEYAKNLQSQQTKRAIKDNFKEGKTHGTIPYGYKKGINNLLIIDEEGAQIIKRIYDLSLSGVGTNKIAEIFNGEAILTSYNKIGKGNLTTTDKYSKKVTVKSKKDIKWSGNTIRVIIKNSIYKGERKLKEDIYKSPIIITPSHWRKVNDNLEKNRNNSGKNVEHKYLLKGLIRCSKCGRNYYGKTRLNKKDHYYMCSSKRYKQLNCGNRSINIDVLDNFIWDRFFKSADFLNLVKEHFENSNNIETINSLRGELKKLTEELRSIDAKRLRIIDFGVDGTITKGELKNRLKQIERQRDDVDIKVFKINLQIEDYKMSEEKIEDINKDFKHIKLNTSFNIKKELINKYIEGISIRYLKDGYFLGVKFKIISLPAEGYMIDRNYNIAYEPIKQIFIGLSEKYKNKEIPQDNKDELTRAAFLIVEDQNKKMKNV